MQGLFLSDVINDMAAGRMALQPLNPHATSQKINGATALDELGAFIQMDGILAHLHSLYMKSRSQHAAARKEHGADSPMADIAADREDSAWCAMQTRLMELRADGALMRQAQKMMRESEEEALRKEHEDKEKQAKELVFRLETALLIKERNKVHHIYEWLILWMLFEPHASRWLPSLGPSFNYRYAQAA